MFSRVMLLGVRRKKNPVSSSPLKMGRRHQNSKEKTGKGKKVKENTGKRGNMQVAGAGAAIREHRMSARAKARLLPLPVQAQLRGGVWSPQRAARSF